MASAIDATKPIFGTPTTASVRANFAAAKAEIDALQLGDTALAALIAALDGRADVTEADVLQIQGATGFADYNDYATGIAALSMPTPSTWTKLPNDALGTFTKIDALPAGVDTLWNATNGQLDFTDLPINSMVGARVDLTVTTTAVNQVVRLRSAMAIGHASAFFLERTQMQFKTAGTYPIVSGGEFYIGSDPVRVNPAEFQLWSDAALTVRVGGWYLRAQKPFG